MYQRRTSWAREAELPLLLLTDGEIRRPPDSTAEEASYHMTVRRLGVQSRMGQLS